MIKRNEKCWCGSGVKSKKCHGPLPPKSAILINGHPNSGKSSARSAVCTMLHEPYFYEDCFDECLITAWNRRTVDKQGFRDAKKSTLWGIVHAVKQRSVVADLLTNTALTCDLRAKLEEDSVKVMTVRLYCDLPEQKRRDQQRLAANPVAPHGFNDGFEVEADPLKYDLELDTTNVSVEDVAAVILEKARATIWKSGC